MLAIYICGMIIGSAFLTSTILLLAVRFIIKRPLRDAFEHIKHSQKLATKNRYLTLLHDIARTLNEAVISEDVYHEILGIVGAMLDYDEMVLLLRDPDAPKLRIAATYGIVENNELLAMEFAAHEGITGEAILKQKMIHVPNTKENARYLYYKGQRPEDVSFLAVPLLGPRGGQVIGVLHIIRPLGTPFEAEELESVQAVSHLIALAITHAQLYTQLKELAIRDELTGLYNRRHGQLTIETEIRRAQRFNREMSLLTVDIDHFKNFNDQYGHPEGDVLLQEFAKVLLSSVRDVDYVCRWGGEEFFIVLPNTNLEGAYTVAEKIRRNISQCRFTSLNQNLPDPVTVSIGVAGMPQHAQDKDSLILQADKALYAAKASGRNQVVIADMDINHSHKVIKRVGEKL